MQMTARTAERNARRSCTKTPANHRARCPAPSPPSKAQTSLEVRKLTDERWASRRSRRLRRHMRRALPNSESASVPPSSSLSDAAVVDGDSKRARSHAQRGTESVLDRATGIRGVDSSMSRRATPLLSSTDPAMSWGEAKNVLWGVYRKNSRMWSEKTNDKISRDLLIPPKMSMHSLHWPILTLWDPQW